MAHRDIVARVAGADLPGNCDGAPSELLPAGHQAAMADNLLTAPVAIAQMVDLSVHSLSTPAALACSPGTVFTASWKMQNPSGRAINAVPFEVSVTSTRTGQRFVLGNGTVDLAPGDTALSMPLSQFGGDTVLRVAVGLNLGPEPRP